MTAQKPKAIATTYVVSSFPPDHPGYLEYSLIVKFRRNWDCRWTVTDGVKLFAEDGGSTYPSVEDRETLLGRYTFEDPQVAIALAKRIVAEIPAEHESGGAA